MNHILYKLLLGITWKKLAIATSLLFRLTGRMGTTSAKEPPFEGKRASLT